MRKFIYLLLFAFVMACSSKDDSTLPGGGDILGNWTVHQFVDEGQDKTSNYNGYIVEFDNGGKLKATKSSDAVSGLWNIFNDRGIEKVQVIWLSAIMIPEPLKDIQEDWMIMSYSSNLLMLKDTSAGFGKSKELHLQRQ